MVVYKALQEFEGKFELEDVLPDWSCRGLPLFPESTFQMYILGLQ